MTMPETPIRIHHLIASNVQCFRYLECDPEGRHITISGENGAGKTAFVKLIWLAIEGIAKKDVAKRIKRGEDTAYVDLDLGRFRIDRRLKDDSITLTVTMADGSSITGRVAEKFLSSLWSKISVNPVRFKDLKPSEQVDIFLAIAKVLPPVDQVKEIVGELASGLGLDPLPGESAEAYLMRFSANETGEVYKWRLYAGREVDQKRKALEEQRQLVERLGGPVSTDAPASGTEILAKLDMLQKQADALREAKQKTDDARRAHREDNATLTALVSQHARKEKEVQDLMDKLKAACLERDLLAGRIEKVQEIVEGLQAEADELARNAAKMPDPSGAIATLRAQLATVEAEKTQRTKRQAACEQQDRLAKELEQSTEHHKRLDDCLEALRRLRANLLEGIDIGIPGLTVEDRELRVDGIPWSEVNEARRMVISAELATLANPGVDFVVIDGGESIVGDTRRELYSWAQRRQKQLVFTCAVEGKGLDIQFQPVEVA